LGAYLGYDAQCEAHGLRLSLDVQLLEPGEPCTLSCMDRGVGPNAFLGSHGECHEGQSKMAGHIPGVGGESLT
jgi:hypothetical protein